MSDAPLTSIVIVGHVDHGKSTFIGRLLFDTNNLAPDRLAEIKKASEEHGRRLEYAFVTDQFEEEREKNVTIDTSQTFLTLDGRPFLIIDAPGHKEYLKNMITGATQASNGIIMLDVAEGIREQTEKHARILKLLGIRRVAVFVNKMDLKEHSETVFRACEREITGLMKDCGIAPAAIVPMSAYNGDNVARRSPAMGWYAGPTAVDFLAGCSREGAGSAPAPLRLPVQLVYVDATRRIAMGRVEQGRISAGQRVTIFPAGAEMAVDEVLKFKEDVSVAGEGECVGIVLSGDAPLERGNVLVSQPTPAARRAAVHAFWASTRPLRVGDEVVAECRTQSARFVVTKISDEIERSAVSALDAGDVGQIEIEALTAVLLDDSPDGAALSRVVFHRDGQVAGCGVVSHVA